MTPLSPGEHARQIEQARVVEVATVVAELVDDADANITLEWMWHHVHGLPNPWAICPLASSL